MKFNLSKLKTCFAAIPVAASLVGCEAALDLSGVENTRQQSILRTDQLQAVAANDTLQVVVGNNGVVLTRTIGAEHWQRQVLTGQPGLIDLSVCPDQSFVALSFDRRLWVSDSSAQAWQAYELPTTENMQAVTYNVTGSIWVAGSFSTLLTSQDRGETWSEVSLYEDSFLTSIQFFDALNGVVTGEFGLLAKTEDGGQSWQVQDPILDEFYPQATWFANPSQGWTVGLDGLVLETTNGGQDWEKLDTPVVAPLYGIIKGQSELFVVGENTTVLKRTGDDWQTIPVSAPPVYLRDGLLHGDGLLVVGGGGLVASVGL